MKPNTQFGPTMAVALVISALLGVVEVAVIAAQDGHDDLFRAPIAVSDDGRTVVYATPGESADWGGPNQLMRYDVATGETMPLLTELAPARFAYPALSYDGRHLAVQMQKGNRPRVGQSGEFFHRELLLAALPADATTPLNPIRPNVLPPRSLAQGDLVPQFSFVGDKLYVMFAFGKYRGGSAHFGSQKIFGVAADGSTSYSLAKSAAMQKSDEFAPIPFRDGRELLTLGQGPTAGDEIRLYRRLAPHGDGRFELPEMLPMPQAAGVFRHEREMQVWWPTTAPRSAIVVAQVGGNNLWSLVAFPISPEAGRSARVLVAGSATESFAHPSLAAGGKWLAYEKWTVEKDRTLNTARVLGTRIMLRNLATNAEVEIAENARFPQISPTGEHVFFFAADTTAPGGWRFCAVDLEGRIPAADLGRLSAAERERLRVLIAQLSHDSYHVRRRATTELMGIGGRAESELRQALLQAEHPETRARLDLILRFIATERPTRPEDSR